MSETKSITPEDVERWAERNDYDADDLDNFASSLYVSGVLLGALSEDETGGEAMDEIDDIYQAVLEASSIDGDGEFVEPLEQYAPKLEMSHPLSWMEDE